MCNDTYMRNADQVVIKQILSVICMILCKRLPDGVVGFPTADISKKVKLLPLPRGMGYDQMQGLQRSVSIAPGAGAQLIE